MFNFPTFQTADFLLQATTLLILGRRAGTLPLNRSVLHIDFECIILHDLTATQSHNLDIP